jgi:hypothetical protein
MLSPVAEVAEVSESEVLKEEKDQAGIFKRIGQISAEIRTQLSL